jgi:two-component system, chemotaxis family, sensor kinase CheA
MILRGHHFGLSIGQKLGLLICVLQLAIVASLGVYFEGEQLRALSVELRSKAETYAQLVSAQVSSAVAFDDQETAREVFDAVSSDDDLTAAVLWDQTGHVLHSWGNLSVVAQNARRGVPQRKVFELPDRILAVAPVQSREGPWGTLALEFTKAKLLDARADLTRAAALAGGLALLVGFTLALLIAQSFARRLRAIAKVAERVADGDLSQQVVADTSRDELGSLSRSFASMLDQIRRLFGTIQRQAAEEQTRLEGLVQERTAALAERNLDLRRVLDNVGQGFLTIDRQGMLVGERSAIVERWLGPVPVTDTLWTYLDKQAPGLGQNLELCWSEVVDGFLPLELALEQMPSRFSIGNQHLSVAYKPILSVDAVLERTVVVLSDITPVVERERAEARQREALTLFSQVNEDPAGVVEFFAEARRLVDMITRETPSDALITKRLVHTLKGIAGMFGIERLSGLCHVIEDAMDEANANISASDRERLIGGWSEIDGQLSKLMDDVDTSGLTISPEDYAEVWRAIGAEGAPAALRAIVESWKLEPTDVRLRRSARQTQALAERLGKVPVDVVVESNRVRLDAELWSDVWGVLPHLIRNAVDHGLEAGPATGQSVATAKIFLRTTLDDAEFAIEVEDLGRGVDWERVRELAVSRGLLASSRADLERALFADGLSTKARADQTSGRGVGMAAVAATVHARGGAIQVFSDGKSGTRVRLSWPAGVARHAALTSRSPRLLLDNLIRKAH